MYSLTEDQFNTIYNMAILIKEDAIGNHIVAQNPQAIDIMLALFRNINKSVNTILDQIDQIQETHHE